MHYKYTLNTHMTEDSMLYYTYSHTHTDALTLWIVHTYARPSTENELCYLKLVYNLTTAS